MLTLSDYSINFIFIDKALDILQYYLREITELSGMVHTRGKSLQDKLRDV